MEIIADRKPYYKAGLTCIVSAKRLQVYLSAFEHDVWK